MKYLWIIRVRIVLKVDIIRQVTGSRLISWKDAITTPP